MRWIAAALFSLGLWCIAQAQVPMTGAGLGVPPASSTSVIKMIQPGSCTINTAASTCTYTISPSITTTANAILIWNGTNSSDTAAQDNRDAATIAITNATTITATRGTAVAFTLQVNFTIVEFASGVNSIQAGTIAIASGGGSSNTATISSVGANAFVLFQGCSAPSSLSNSFIPCGVTLTNATTVTAVVGASASVTQTVGYMVADLGSSIVSAVQQEATSMTSGSTSDTDTITSVTVGNVLLMYGGYSSQVAQTYPGAYRTALTNGTTVTKTRAGSNASARTVYYTAVSFAASALNGSVQRGTIALSSQTSNTATITSITTAKSFVNWGNFSAAAGNGNAVLPTLVLTNSTTVTAAVNTAGSPTVSYEVMQFNYLLRRDLDPASNDNAPEWIDAAA
jgi:hypothetical protein